MDRTRRGDGRVSRGDSMDFLYDSSLYAVVTCVLAKLYDFVYDMIM